MYDNEGRCRRDFQHEETLIGTADFEDGGRGPMYKGIPDSSINWENPQLTVSKEIGISVPQL